MSDAPRGAVGALSKGFRAVSGLLHRQDTIAIYLVFAAGVLTVLHKAGVPIPHYAMIFGVSLGIAALLYEMNAAKSALNAFWKGRAVGTIGWSFVWVVAFAYSMNQWIGAASENEGNKSNMHKAAYVASQNASKSLEDARKALRAEEANYEEVAKLTMTPLPMVDGKPVANAAAAVAMINGFKGNSRFWTATDGCKDAQGKSARKFCADYAAAVAAKADLEGRKDWDGKLVLATQQRDNARKAFRDAEMTASNTKVETSEARNDLFLLTDWLGVSEQNASRINALGSIIAISIFLSVATMLKELEHLRETSRRQPMLGWLVRAWDRYILGKDVAVSLPQNVTVERSEVTNLHYLDLVSAKALTHGRA